MFVQTVKVVFTLQFEYGLVEVQYNLLTVIAVEIINTNINVLKTIVVQIKERVKA